MIALTDVVLRRGDNDLLGHVNLRIEPGDGLVISGPTGSGKSALLALLAGRVLCDEGRVEAFGHDLAKLRASSRERLRRWVAVAPEESIFIEEQSALANVVVACEVAGLAGPARAPRAAELLGELSLGHLADARCNELSSGERSLLAVARALALEPKVIVADEPCARLSPDVTEMVAEALQRRRADGASVVVTGNDAELVAATLRMGWRHYHIVGGSLRESRYRREQFVHDDVVVPFPVTAVSTESSSGARSA